MCSLHHTGSFAPPVSSIWVSRLPEGSYEIHTEVTTPTTSIVRSLCDNCEDETQPWCARWCPTGAVRVENVT